MKICTACKKEKNLEDFYSYGAECKKCRVERSRKYSEKNSEKIKLYQQKYKKENKEKFSQYFKKYRLKNLEKKKKYHSEYEKARRKLDVNFRLTQNLRARLRGAIKRNQKSGSAIQDLGCSIEELKQHLESKFQIGMTWDNYGEWHIDHVVPLSKFDLTNKNQVKEACNYTNLQPLWAEDNFRKYNHAEH